MKDIHQILADNLRIYRKLKGLSQEKLGEMSGLHRTYIGGIEQQNTNVSINNVQKIAHALQINPVLLFMKAPDDFINAAKKRGKSAQSALDDLGFKPGGYALCSWEDDEIVVEPLPVSDPNLAISILVALIDQGHTENLSEDFKVIQQRILDLAAATQYPAQITTSLSSMPVDEQDDHEESHS